MAQALDQLLVHFVTSTKYCTPLITPGLRPRLYEYIAGLLERMGCPSFQMGGSADHIHIFFALGSTIAASDVVGEIKKSSDKWMKMQEVNTFAWQSGHGIFSIGDSQLDHMLTYLQKQDEVHQKISYQEEMRWLLKQRKIAYDERYVWD